MKLDKFRFIKLQPILTIGCLFVFFLGALKTFQTNDFHHWETIVYGVEHAYLKAYTSLYVQYGMLTNYILYPLMKLIEPFGVSPRFMVGIFFSAVFSITLAIHYLVTKKMSDGWFASAMAIFFITIYPRIQYPWPDYLSGLFLSLTLLLFIRKERFSFVWLCAFINLALFSREASIMMLIAICFFFLWWTIATSYNYLKEIRYILFALLIHYLILFLFLGDIETIKYFFLQTFNISPFGSEAQNSVFFLIKRYIFLVSVNEPVHTYFFISSAILSIFFLATFFQNKAKNYIYDRKVLTIFTFGLSGYAMSVHIPELFRFQIYSFSLFLGIFLFIYRYLFPDKRKMLLLVLVLCAPFLALNIKNKFRDASDENLLIYHTHPIAFESYSMSKESYDFYQAIFDKTKSSCVYNLTHDPMLEKMIAKAKFHPGLPYFSSDFIKRLPNNEVNLRACLVLTNQNFGVECDSLGKYPRGIPFISGEEIFVCNVNNSSILAKIKNKLL